MINRIISFLLFLLFAVFAYVQLNDPDPILWVIAYLIVAIVCLARSFNYSWKYINLTIHIGFVIASFFFIGGVYEWLTTDNKSEIFGEMVYQKPYIEETREFLGLTIAAITMFYQYRVAKSWKPKSLCRVECAYKDQDILFRNWNLLRNADLRNPRF